jgi:HEAT repeat protein
MIRFNCPSCKAEYDVKNDSAGRKFNCDQCGQRLQVPAAPKRENKTVLGELNGELGERTSDRQPAPGKPVGMIIGICVGVAVFLALGVVLLVVCLSGGNETPKESLPIAKNNESQQKPTGGGEFDLGTQAAKKEREKPTLDKKETATISEQAKKKDEETAPQKSPEDPTPDKKDSGIVQEKKEGSSKGYESTKNLIVPFIPEKEIVTRVKNAGGKIGRVTVSLAWKNKNDLDLHVLTAKGEDICFHNRRSSCGGLLDVDENVKPTTSSPVENVFWPESSPPKGELKIYVHHFHNHGLAGCQDPTPFVVRVQIGQDVKVYEGSVSFKPFAAAGKITPNDMAWVANVNPEDLSEHKISAEDAKKYQLPNTLPALLPSKKSLITRLELPPPKSLAYRVLDGPEEKEAKPFRLGISPPMYDDMGRLLNKLGDAYKYTHVNELDLQDSKALAQFNVLFLTCSSNSRSDQRAAACLRKFVEEGSTLYASDLRFDLLALAFPEWVDFRLVFPGRPQDVAANVIDPGLKRVLGKDLKLHFNLASWRPAAFRTSMITTFLEGDCQSGFAKSVMTPLMVKFKCKDGLVIFTSFHNAAQNDENQLKLLQYMVFAAVNAKMESRVTKHILDAGFSPREVKNLNLSAGVELAPQAYVHEKPGSLQFAVGFGGLAKFRLVLTAPNGEKIAHEGTRSFTIEVADAPTGTWQYSIAALETPYANFLYTLAIGQEQMTHLIERALSQLDTEQGSGFSRLVKGLRHSKPAVRLLSVNALDGYVDLLGQKKMPALDGGDVAALATLLKSNEDARWHPFALEFLGGLGPKAKDAVPALLEVAGRSQDTKILAGCINVLRSIGVNKVEVLTTLVDFLDHKDVTLKDASLLALITLGPERLQTDRLLDAMGGPNEEVRGAAGKLLRQRLSTSTAKDLPALRRGLKNPFPEVRLAFIDAVGLLKAEAKDAAPELEALLSSKEDKPIRVAAIRALGNMGKAVQPALPSLLKVAESTKDRDLAFAATMAIHQVDPSNPFMQGDGLNLLLDGLKASASVNVNAKDLATLLEGPLENPAVPILVAIGPSAVKPIFKRLLNANDPRVAVEKQGAQATASRYIAYSLLREFAKKAKANPKDTEFAAALQAQETTLRSVWKPREAELVSKSKKATGVTPELRELYVQTDRSVAEALAAVVFLRERANSKR